MTSGGGDLQRALRGLLALDVGEIRSFQFGYCNVRIRLPQHLIAAEMIDKA